MADGKNGVSQITQGQGPLGQSGVSPSGTVQRNYQSEFVSKHQSQTVQPRQVPSSTTGGNSKDSG
jgi:hypothetical protein